MTNIYIKNIRCGKYTYPAGTATHYIFQTNIPSDYQIASVTPYFYATNNIYDLTIASLSNSQVDIIFHNRTSSAF